MCGLTPWWISLYLSFNKEIKGRTFILPEHASKDFRKYNLSSKDGGETELVKLENPEFEKIFKVFSSFAHDIT